jgi:hypothetical protein
MRQVPFRRLTSGIDWITWSSGREIGCRGLLARRMVSNRSRSALRSSSRSWGVPVAGRCRTIGFPVSVVPAKRPADGFVSARRASNQANDIWPVEAGCKPSRRGRPSDLTGLTASRSVQRRPGHGCQVGEIGCSRYARSIAPRAPPADYHALCAPGYHTMVFQIEIITIVYVRTDD